MNRSTTQLLAIPLALGVALGVATTGCKKGSGASGDKKQAERVGACNRIQLDSVCFEYHEGNFQAAGEKYLKEVCSILKGQYSRGPCPAKGRVGACVSPEGWRVSYSVGGSPTTAASAKAFCGKSKQWKPAK